MHIMTYFATIAVRTIIISIFGFVLSFSHTSSEWQCFTYMLHTRFICQCWLLAAGPHATSATK